MAFRPQFAFPTSDGFIDELAEYPFDQRQSPGAGCGNLTLAGSVNQILRLDADADYLWRSVYWEFPAPLDFADGLNSPIAVRLRDAYGNYLSSDYIPILEYFAGYYVFVSPWSVVSNAGIVGPSFVGPLAGGMGCALSEEIFCPASSVLQIDAIPLDDPTYATSNIGRFLFRGVKRRPVSDCSQEYR